MEMSDTPLRKDVNRTESSTLLSEASLDTLAQYAATLFDIRKKYRATLAELERQERADRDALAARYGMERKTTMESRDHTLQKWLEQPGKRDAILALSLEGGDAASIQNAEREVVERLVLSGMTEEDAKIALREVARRPLMRRPSPSVSRHVSDTKTDPLRESLDVLERIK
jgi:hypothetical protein